MAQSLGSIYLNLTAETGGFVSALSKAAAEAQKASKEIARSFADLGEIASQTFGAFGEQFNPIISKLSFVLSSAGSAASGAMKEFSKMGGALGPIAALGAGAAVGLAAASAVMVGIAVHAAESAEKLLELSRSTGISVEQLSALQFAAKQTGIDQEQLVKSLQLLSANMVKAAQVPKGASTAFSRLFLDIRQGNGDLKNSAEFMGEVITKLSQMRDQTAAVGLAKQMMGRGGAAILQLGDPEEIQHWIDKAKELGVVISTGTAQAAEHFNQTLGVIGAQAQGVANRLMEELLPALQATADFLANGMMDNQSAFSDFLEKIAYAAKDIVAMGVTAWSAFETISLALKHVGADLKTDIDLIEALFKAASHGDFSGINKAWTESLQKFKDSSVSFNEEFIKIWTEQKNFVQNALGPRPPWTLSHKGGNGDSGLKQPGEPGGGARPDVVAEMIAKLQAQAAAELQLAMATEKSTSATLLAKAAAEADVKIAELRAHLLEQEKVLRERLATEPDSKHVPTLQAEITDIQNVLAELEKNTPKIKALYAEIASAGFGKKAGEDLNTFDVKVQQETQAHLQMAEAIDKGPAAAQEAEVNAKIQPSIKAQADLGELIAALNEIHFDSAYVAGLQKTFDDLGAAIKRVKAAGLADSIAEVTEKIARNRAELSANAKAYELIGAAALKSAADQREAAAQAEVAKVKAKLPTAPASLLQSVHDEALQALEQERVKTIAQIAVQFDLNASYTQELEKLQEVKAFLEKSGESTIAIDTKIYETRIQQTQDFQKQVFDSQNEQLLGQQKLYDLNVQLTEQWDKAALAVGTYGDKFRAMLNEVQLQGQNLGGKIFESFSKAIDDASGELAKFVVTGQANFKKLFQGLEEQVVKASFQKMFSGIVTQLAPGGPTAGLPGQTPTTGGGILGTVGKIFGLDAKGGAPKGTRSDPLFVSAIGAGGGLLGGLGGGSGDSGSPFGDSGLDNLPLTNSELGDMPDFFSEITGSLTSVLSRLGGGLTGIFGGLGSLFGGFLAGGGDVTPGKAYVVGEKRPELFVPRQAGRVLSTTNVGGGETHHHTTVNLHVHGVTDTDSFRRSGPQVAAQMQRILAVAYSRTR